MKHYNPFDFYENNENTIDEKTIYELMKLYNINYDISKLYLDNIKYVGPSANYNQVLEEYEFYSFLKKR